MTNCFQIFCWKERKREIKIGKDEENRDENEEGNTENAHESEERSLEMSAVLKKRFEKTEQNYK